MNDPCEEEEQRPDEAFAFRVVRRVLRAKVCLYDKDKRQNAVDGIITYPNRGQAALEVSSLGLEEEARIYAVLNRDGEKRGIPGLQGTWDVQVPPTFHPADLHRLDSALLICERLGASSLHDAAYATQEPLLRELAFEGVSAFQLNLKREPIATIFVELPGGATYEHDEIPPLADEVSAALAEKKMIDKLDKLAKSKYEERHLFLFVRPSGFTFPVYDRLGFGGTLPEEAPQLPSGLTQLWLTTSWAAGGVVRAIAGTGWVRDFPFDTQPLSDAEPLATE